MTEVSVHLKHEARGRYVIETTSQAAIRKLNASIPEGSMKIVRVVL